MHRTSEANAIAATEIIGMAVVNHEGENLGEIEDFVLDMETGRIAYAVLSLGGFLGLGDKLFAVPFQSLTLDLDQASLVMDADREKLQNAPGFDKENWPRMGDRKWGSKIFAFYEKEPYWNK